MTSNEILTVVDRKYPNQESQANKIIDLNRIQKNIFMKMKNIVTKSKISYYDRPPTEITTLNLDESPTLEVNYHDLMVYALIQELASQGNNPDAEIADFYQVKYDEFFDEIKDSVKASDDNQVIEWW